ncbi:MAG: hypothetical protein ACW99E_21440 [Promethearchaeota archaeon]|jgi:hypothetical protein
MFERTQSFLISGQNCDRILQRLESILQNKLTYSVNTVKLGKSLLRINYYDDNIDKEIQKDNRITILQEPEKKVYIQIKGRLTDDQVRQIWSGLEVDFSISHPIEERKLKILTTADITEKITEIIKLKGYNIKNEEAKTFIENFQEKYKRLPEEEEINSIVKGYIIMVNEDYLLDKTETTVKDDILLKSGEPEKKIGESILPSSTTNNSAVGVEDSIGRRKCPSCGDQSSIHEVIDKSSIIMDYPRIYGKKKYCGRCGHEWKK